MTCVGCGRSDGQAQLIIESVDGGLLHYEALCDHCAHLLITNRYELIEAIKEIIR